MGKRRRRGASISYKMYVLEIGKCEVCDICGYYTWIRGIVQVCRDGIQRCSRCRMNLHNKLDKIAPNKVSLARLVREGK